MVCSISPKNEVFMPVSIPECGALADAEKIGGSHV
jgi:hypothetical protein